MASLLSPAECGLSMWDNSNNNGISHASRSSSSSSYIPGLKQKQQQRGRPVIRRTASTADVNEIGELNLPPSMQGRRREIDSDDDEVDQDCQLGMQEDWVPEDDDNDNDNNPFTGTPSHSMMMMLDDNTSSPPSSPTLATRKVSSSKAQQKQRMLVADSSDEEEGTTMATDREDADNNPFLEKPSTRENTSSSQQRMGNDGMPKVSYVFRGKRITYDAPLSSLFPNDPDEGSSSTRQPTARVLFQKASTTSTPASTSRTLPTMMDVSPPASTSRNTIRDIELMQTPRRRQPVHASTSTPFSGTSTTLVGSDQRAGIDGKREEDHHHHHPPPSRPAFIPPTPASLPQKSKEQRQLERERFNGASRGLHSRGTSISSAPKRFMPYPPR